MKKITIQLSPTQYLAANSYKNEEVGKIIWLGILVQYGITNAKFIHSSAVGLDMAAQIEYS